MLSRRQWIWLLLGFAVAVLLAATWGHFNPGDFRLVRECFDHPYAAIAVAVVLMAGVAIVYTREVWLRLLIGVGLAVFL